MDSGLPALLCLLRVEPLAAGCTGRSGHAECQQFELRLRRHSHVPESQRYCQRCCPVCCLSGV
uniref:Secreted protein n=1 Tax=Macrostomum lignano TaxID=282301 RepID=A0A1I8IHI7_9PLAT